MEKQNNYDSSDIVEELHDWAFICNESQGKARVVMLSGAIFEEAAEEITKLKKTINQIQHWRK